jgi:outer membrane immunogenic protein
MHKRFAAILLCAACSFTTLSAYADGWNLGFKLTYFEVDMPNTDDPDNAGLLVGYDWVKDYGLVGIEGDFTTTFEDGSLAGQPVSVDTAGIFATYRTKAASADALGFYLKLKGGVTYYDLSIGSTNTDETEASFGVGAGVNMGFVSFELDLTTVGDSEMVNFMILF